MQNKKEYIIQFVGLGLGEHLYEYHIGDAFFKDLEYSEIKHATIDVKLQFLKQSSMMILHFEIKGTVKTQCDRCTEDFDMPISGTYKLIVKVGGSVTGDEDDDIITVSANEHELDLSQYLYEYITLSLPIKRIHLEDKNGNPTCNKDMLKKLDSFLTDDDKKEAEEPIDPRWEALKKIQLN